MVQILRALSGLEEKETLQLFAPKKLSKSGSIFRYNSIVCVCKWRDKRDVLPISTKHSPELMNVTKKRGQTVLKPDIVVEYNKFIIGVDRHDQMLSYYTCDHKQDDAMVRKSRHSYLANDALFKTTKPTFYII